MSLIYTSEIHRLSPEILEQIFKELDGQSFVRIAMTCRRFNDIAKHLEKSLIWKILCYRDIPMHNLEELFGNRCYTKNLTVNWKHIYKVWCRGNMIKLNTFNVIEISVPNELITCAKLSEQYIITGHITGAIYAWKDSKFHHTITRHLDTVVDFIVFDDLIKSNANISTYVISIARNCKVRINFLDNENYKKTIYEYCDINGAFKCIKVFDDTVAIAKVNFRNTWILLFKMIRNETGDLIELQLNRTIIQSDGPCKTFMYWKNEIRTVSYFRNIYTKYSLSDEVITKQNIQFVDHKRRPYKQNYFWYVFLFYKEIGFFITDDDNLFVTIDNRHVKEIETHSIIVCMAFRGSVLVAAAECGCLMMYHIPQVSKMLKINLLIPDWSKPITNSLITSVDIADMDNSPSVIACTCEKIFFIQWYRP